MQPDIVVLVRFYLKKKVQGRLNQERRQPPHSSSEDHKLYQDEVLTAWATMPLFYPRRNFLLYF